MKTIAIDILYDNGVQKIYTIEVKKEATEQQLLNTMEDLKSFFAESFKEGKKGNFNLITQYKVNVIINLVKITSVEMKIIELEQYLY